MASRNLSFALMAFVALAVSVRADKTATEAPISLGSMMDNIEETIQKATAAVEGAFGVDLPNSKDEVKTALQDNLDNLQKSAQTFQKKLAEYNVTGSSLGDMWNQIQGQVNGTINDLSQRNPDLGKLLEQVKTGYNGLVDASKKVSDVVSEQAGSASVDLKNIAQQARTELSKAATQLEAKVQEVLAENQKKSKTS